MLVVLVHFLHALFNYRSTCNRSRVARRQVFQPHGRYFTANLAEAGILIFSARSLYFENKLSTVTLKRTNTEFLKF